MSATGKFILFLGVLTLGFTLVIFAMAGKVHALSGEHILDMRFWGSSPNSVAAFVAALKASGAESLHARIRVLDLMYPVVYGGFGVLWLFHLFAGSKLRLLCLLPFAALVFDYLENNLIANLTAEGAIITGEIVSQMTCYTQTKYSSIVLSLIVLAFGLAWWRKMKTRRLRQA